VLVQIVVSEDGGGSELVGLGSVRCETQIVLVEGESGFEELTSVEIMLIFDACDVGALDVLGIGELRALRR